MYAVIQVIVHILDILDIVQITTITPITGHTEKRLVLIIKGFQILTNFLLEYSGLL